MGEVKFISAMLFIALFSIAVVSYAINFAGDNTADVDLGTDSEFDSFLTNLNQNQSEFYTKVNGSDTAFAESEIGEGDETTRTGGQFKGNSRALITSLLLIFSLVKSNIFGGSNAFGVILLGFGSFITYVAIAYAWKTWKGGNPD